MRKRTLPLAIGLGLVATLPILDHADQASCCTATSSLASTVNDPVAGDEAFFSQAGGPSNVVFLLDVSGSMKELPQCGDEVWDSDNARPTCQSPSFTLANPRSRRTSPTYTVTGTCTPHTSGLTTATSNLAWMEAVKPQRAYADAGQTNSLLWDCPPWGNGGAGCGTKVCSGDGCLFDPDAYYRYGDWRATGGGPDRWWPRTTRRELESVARPGTATEPTAPCVALDEDGDVITDYKSGEPADLGQDCRDCMATRGFYIYRINYFDAWGDMQSVTAPLFRGTFLNANPPKFVTARQVLKANAWMDPAAPRAQDQIRLGLAITDSQGWSNRQAQLIVPLGPDKGAAYPPTQAKFRQARQYLLSVLNYDTSRYPETGSDVICDGSATAFSDAFFHPANGATPLASALFNVGQYFTTHARNTSELYDRVFGTGYTTSEFYEKYAGRTNAPWVTDTTRTQCSICWPCQASSIVVITDGSPNSEIDFPDSLRTYDDAGYGLSSNCAGTYAAGDRVPSRDTTFRCTSPSDNGRASGLPRVADWLHTKAASTEKAPTGLRYDLALTGEKDALRISTIGINLTDRAAQNILEVTATLGNGVFANAADPEALATAVASAVNLVAPKQLSFGAGGSSALQTVQTSSAQAFLTRFRPTDQGAWEGHLSEAFLFDEFLNRCDPQNAIQPTVACGQASVKQVSADFDGDGRCDGTFLIDLDCDQIVEDGKTGAYLKLRNGAPAKLGWDAGQVLSFETLPGSTSKSAAYRSASDTTSSGLRPRAIFTWIDGARVEFTRDGASTLLPYLNVGAAWCTSFLKQLRIDGGANARLECAKQIISYVRGWDVLDQDHDGCAGPGNPANKSTCQRGYDGEERDRPMDPAYGTSATPSFWKLGDIVHSSPAVLTAPVAPVRCDTGYDPQCTWGIRSPPGVPGQTPMDASCTRGDCYSDYRTANLERKRVVLVGANDGMLHAFDAGSARTSGKPDMSGSFPYDNGSGEELWAFIPPDMLPRLKDLLTGHRYMVDGSVMLRDVWVDGSGRTDGERTPAPPSGQDGTKQVSEFHTVAVFGRRAGGNQYTALDVTDPAAPTFLWSFPRTGSDDARFMGESWNDFAPRPPPIVPVRLAATSTSPELDRDRTFSERWVVMFGGGYDPTLTLGRAVFMVDVWTGKTIWRFTDDDFKAKLGFSGPSAPSMFPVAGGLGLLDLGRSGESQALDVDTFFDTATWGDLGGNVFVARFHDPGVIGTTGRVENWYAARAFEQLRRSDDAQYVSDGSGAGRNEFFSMTANAFDPATLTLRTFLGSGNREQLMRPSAAWCGTDNLFGCCQAGCTSVTATTAENDGACSHADTFSCVNGLLTHGTSNSCPEDGTTCAASPGDLFTRTVNLSWTCPGAGTTTASGAVTFDGSGLGSVAAVGRVSTTSASFAAPTHNRFYGFISYGGEKKFSDAASAKAFDRNRFTDVAFSGRCAGRACSLVNTTQATATYDTSTFLATTTCKDGSGKCTATASDPGWFYEYGDVCPLESCENMPLPWVDEKTGAGANVILGCVDWSGFRPFGTSTSSDPCSGPSGTPTALDYSVHYLSGAPTYACSYASGGTAYAASRRSATGAPGGSGVRVDVTDDGRINYSSLRLGDSGPGRPGTGAGAISHSYGTLKALGAPIYWLQVPQQLHNCRHVSSDSCN